MADADAQANHQALAIGILVIGLASLVVMPFLGPVALILYWVHLRECARTSVPVRQEAKIGAVLGGIATGVFVMAVVAAVVLVVLNMVIVLIAFMAFLEPATSALTMTASSSASVGTLLFLAV